jgi:hypothetical protein
VKSRHSRWYMTWFLGSSETPRGKAGSRETVGFWIEPLNALKASALTSILDRLGLPLDYSLKKRSMEKQPHTASFP